MSFLTCSFYIFGILLFLSVVAGLAFSQIYGFGSINLKSMQAENLSNIFPPTSRSSNYVALRYCDLSPDITVRCLTNNFVPSIELIHA